MYSEPASSSECTWIQTFVAITTSEENEEAGDFKHYKGLIVSLPLLRPFSDAFVMQAALLSPAVDVVCASFATTSACKFLWATPTLAATEIKLARSRSQLTADAVWSQLNGLK